MKMRIIKAAASAAAAGTAAAAAALAAAFFLSPEAPQSGLFTKPESTLVLAENGEFLSMNRAADGIFRAAVKLENVSPQLIEATLFYEDKLFWSHPGVNVFSLVRGAFSSLFGRKIGGSTITMQVARMTTGLDTSTPAGKLMQCMTAFKIEAKYSKKEILEAYFNLAPYGGNIEGVEAASRIYFHKSASELSAHQAAALAVVPQNPVKRNPVSGPDFEKARLALGARLIEEEVFPERTRRLLRLSARDFNVWSPSDLPFRAPHFSRMIQAKTTGIVKTTLDLSSQQTVERILEAYVRRRASLLVDNAAAIVVDNRTNSIAAYVGSADFHSSSISGEIDALQTQRSPASTVKTFIYALALEEGLIHPGSILFDREERFAGWAPENADGVFTGPLKASEALVASRNIPAVSLAGELKRRSLYDLYKAAGVPVEFGPEHYGLGAALGGIPISPVRLAELYSALANKGLYSRAAFVKNEERRTIPLFSEEASYITLKMLEERGESAAGIPLLYKTGTSNGFKDAWCAGVFGGYTIIVWLGDMSYRSNPHFSGAALAAPLFAEIAYALSSSTEPLDDEKPEGVLEVPYCSDTGEGMLEGCPNPGRTLVISGATKLFTLNVIRPVYIDSATGLRTNRIGDPGVEKRYMQIWPSQYLASFQKAGIKKSAPPAWESSASAAAAPKIISPQAGEKFLAEPGASSASIIFEASSQNPGEDLYLWVDDGFVRRLPSGSTATLDLEIGVRRLSIVDSQGNASSISIEVAPAE